MILESTYQVDHWIRLMKGNWEKEPKKSGRVEFG
jgi:hypothetical protein